MKRFFLPIMLAVLAIGTGCGRNDSRIHIGRPGGETMGDVRLSRGLRREVFYVGGPAFPGSSRHLIILLGAENLLPEYQCSWNVLDMNILQLDPTWEGDILTRTARMLPQNLGETTVTAWETANPGNIDTAQVIILPSAVLSIGANRRFLPDGSLISCSADLADLSIVSSMTIRFRNGGTWLGGGQTDNLGDMTADAADPGHEVTNINYADSNDLYVFWDGNGRKMGMLGSREGLIYRELAPAP